MSGIRSLLSINSEILFVFIAWILLWVFPFIFAGIFLDSSIASHSHLLAECSDNYLPTLPKCRRMNTSETISNVSCFFSVLTTTNSHYLYRFCSRQNCHLLFLYHFDCHGNFNFYALFCLCEFYYSIAMIRAIVIAIISPLCILNLCYLIIHCPKYRLINFDLNFNRHRLIIPTLIPSRRWKKLALWAVCGY